MGKQKQKLTGKQLVAQNSMLIPGGNLDAYISAVHSMPVLSAGEERDLLLAYANDNDLDAARQLILCHLRFVVHVSRGYLGYGLPFADLIQEGTVGMMKAVKRFDVSREVRFASFAVHWVKAEIHEYIIRNWRMVKIATTKAHRKLFFNLRSTRNQLGQMSEREIREVADKLDVEPRDVRHMATRFNAADLSFDTPDADDENAAPAPEQYLSSAVEEGPAGQAESDNWSDKSRQYLDQALSQLSDRMRDIVESRHLCEPGQKLTLQKLASRYGISIERVRQLEQEALIELRHHLEPLLV